jgi:hypothetical protein
MIRFHIRYTKEHGKKVYYETEGVQKFDDTVLFID